MTIINEIRDYFAALQPGYRRLNSTGEYAAYVIKDNGLYGVAVPYADSDMISEKFSSCRMMSQEMFIEGNQGTYLLLVCYEYRLRNEFATLCAQFTDPGESGCDRKKLISDPRAWWELWCELLGNKISEKAPYAEIAEMLVLDYLYQKDKTIKWTAKESGSHDIESDTRSFEVKSTVSRYDAEITITGQHQLYSERGLELYFLRMEKSNSGVSVDDVKEQLVAHGYDAGLLEDQLISAGFEMGSGARKLKYKVLEKRVYTVDDKFPKITNDSFVSGHIPDSIKRISYTIDLNGIDYKAW